MLLCAALLTTWIILERRSGMKSTMAFSGPQDRFLSMVSPEYLAFSTPVHLRFAQLLRLRKTSSTWPMDGIKVVFPGSILGFSTRARLRGAWGIA